MRDRFARFHGEFEFCGRRRAPSGEELFCRWEAKCLVQFDGIEPRGVIAEKLCSRKLGRIEVGLPARISPSRRARVYCPHVVFPRGRPVERQAVTAAARKSITQAPGILR